MQINRTLKTQPIQHVSKAAAPAAAQATQPSESFTFSESKTPPLVKVGKYALAATATVGAGALAYFASNNVGTAATVAGVASGALAGATALGTAGLIGDIMGGVMGNSNNTRTGLIVGSVAGAAVGGAIGAFVQDPVVGGIMGVASGVAALAVTSSATNILAK